MVATSSHSLRWFYLGVLVASLLFGISSSVALSSSVDEGVTALTRIIRATIVPHVGKPWWYVCGVAALLLCASIGATHVFIFVAKLMQFAATQFLRPALDLESRYGSGSWAVVSGASRGIGLGFAVELAKRNFNIVLIARCPERLRAAEEEVRSACPGVKTRIIVADFCESGNSVFWDRLYNENLAGLDVSVLVNNVGINHTEPFNTIPEKFLQDIVAVNCTAQLLMTRRLIQQMVNRSDGTSRRSAIISVSSVAGQRPLLFLAPYSATKAFNDFFSRALALEFSDKIDVLSLRPGYVVSNMSKLTDKGGFVLDKFECASGCLEKLGHVTETYGDPRHAIYARTFFLLPEFVLSRRRRLRLREKSALIAAEAQPSNT